MGDWRQVYCSGGEAIVCQAKVGMSLSGEAETDLKECMKGFKNVPMASLGCDAFRLGIPKKKENCIQNINRHVCD
jgi:hypothetical protein